MPLRVRIKRLDKTLPIPNYQTEGSSGLDLYAREECIVRPGDFKTIPTGITIEVPEGMEGQVRARSGLAATSGIGVLNSPGTIDSDYRGEIKVILFNFSDKDFKVGKGDRIAQLVITSIVKVELKEVENLGETQRNKGGFGSTSR
ncbi:dUTP diphosphatase [candidate division WOR-3 bacterium]|jgi:dUTP pyrophosphatase|nr:dUTP diphosphatase [candidate division WOR-3 bacterium]